MFDGDKRLKKSCGIPGASIVRALILCPNICHLQLLDFSVSVYLCDCYTEDCILDCAYVINLHCVRVCDQHRRKRGERDVADTPGDVIVRKLTVERIEELKRIIQEEKTKYRYADMYQT